MCVCGDCIECTLELEAPYFDYLVLMRRAAHSCIFYLFPRDRNRRVPIAYIAGMARWPTALPTAVRCVTRFADLAAAAYHVSLCA
jgi:hypothetical protein